MRTLLLVALLGVAACGGPAELSAVSQLNVNRYLGTWYDIASFPQSFQEGCNCTTATYSLRDNGEIDVLNQCRKLAPDGELDEANARAFIPDERFPGKLKVEFFWPFAADYWVIDLGGSGSLDYTYAVVSEPSRNFLWILSRTSTMDADTYADILTRLEQKGFDLERLQQTTQEGCW